MGAEFNKSSLSRAASFLNSAVGFLVFSFLDVLDAILCVVYKLVDSAMETDSRPCYCSPEEVTISGDFLVSATKGRTVVPAAAKLRLGDVSDTLYYRPSQVAELTKKAAIAVGYKTSRSIRFTVSSDVIGAFEEKTSRGRRPLWSDCDCKKCNSPESHLYVHVEGPKDTSTTTTDVIFIHGFISSSAFWTETVFPEFSDATKSNHRMFAVDLLGFGRSPKPADSLYTLREQVDMIEKSILKRHNVRSFHIVAHSMGCIIALALAVEHPEAVKSLALIAPPYFPVPEGEKAAQFVMRQVAPKKVWPPIMFGASMSCWYEHVSRTICLLICRNHRLWEFLFRLITRNRIRTYMMDAFMCHTHRAAWHSLHNVICGSAEAMERYMDRVNRRSCCDVAVFHGDDDDVLPVDCSYAVGSRIPRARVKVFQRKDHITIVVGHHKALAGELEQIWRNAGSPTSK
ncbi:probable lysophospholipase BODYGUARD 3 [Musa acuminata AAA Group]|uniref:probable lysophospholipase BODYGUARD 3 n=1 Tax=Musa acuminata AAA Group TaxID=214697 RepID=UPI0031E2E8F4